MCCVDSVVRRGLKLKNSRNSLYQDFISIKIIKFTSNAFDSHLCEIIINDLKKSKYSKETKIALVTPIFKKNERNKIGNYRPVNIFNRMSKIYERCIHNSLSSFTETIPSKIHINL